MNRNLILFAGWDSHYVTEGRDNLSGEGLSSFTAELELGNFLFGTWLTQNEDLDYDEQNYYAQYGFEFLSMELYLGYTHLQLQSDGDVDHEIGAGLAFPELTLGIIPSLDWYHSFEADGSFYEISLTRDCEITDRLTLSPAVILGFNDGYIGDGHDGANHLGLQLGIRCRISEALSLETFLTQNFAIDRDPARFSEDENLIDLFYASISLKHTF